MTTAPSSPGRSAGGGTEPRAAADGRPLLRAVGLERSFPGVRAVRGVDLELHPGEVHALIGENGAGKSTLIKLVTGALVPDAGSVEVNGRAVALPTPAAALRVGIAAIHQEPHVVPALSPVENVYLGHPLARFGFTRQRQMDARFEARCEELGVGLPTRGPAGSLPVGAQQMIEIVRALEHGAHVVIMDEPTASLGREDRDALFRVIELIRAQGAAVVFISHNLDDVVRVSDRVSVMRDGSRVLTERTSNVTIAGLVDAMLGRELEAVLQAGPTAVVRHPSAEPRLVVRDLNVGGRLQGVDLEVAPGEIVGLAGLVGSGRSTLVRALAGAEPSSDGAMWIDGRPVRWPTSPRRARALGIALAPEDRRTEGLVLGLPVADNLVLPSLTELSRAGFATAARLRVTARQEALAVGFDPDRVGTIAGTLSGGNQQKVVLGKLLHTRPGLLLVDEPAKGVDIGAKAEIFRMIEQLAAEGMAVVMVSEETEELVSLTDRVLVLCEGRVVTTFPGRTTDPERVLAAMFPTAA